MYLFSEIMKVQLTITSLICLSLASYFHFASSQERISKLDSQPQIEVQKVDYVNNKSSNDSSNNLEQALMIKRSGQNINENNPNYDRFQSSENLIGDNELAQLNLENPTSENNENNNYLSAVGGNYMSLEPTGLINNQGNPLYHLNLYVKGELVQQYLTVTGRAYTQNRNRNTSGTEAPLPDGDYTVSFNTVPATHVEVGDRFLPIQPTFRTNRTFLGIHYDPSYEKTNGEDGTAGCIALTNRGDFSKLLQYISSYRPQYLTVDIQ